MNSTSNEQLELLDLVSRFFKSEISGEYLRGRLEPPRSSDPELWDKLRELGFFEYFQELSLKEGAIALLAEVARESGKVPLPESLYETLFAGPVLLSVLLKGTKDEASVRKFLGEDYEGILNGEKTVAILPPAFSDSVTIDLESKDASGTFTGLQLHPGTVAILCLQGENLFLLRVSSSSSLDDISPSASLDRLIPRGVFRAKEKHGSLPLKSIDAVQWLSYYRLLIAAELLGMAERCIELTREYVSERKQFGVAVGCFQAVSQPLADAYLKSRELESIIHFAKGATERSDPQLEVLSLVSLSAALSRVPFIIEKCLQLHGGIGFTWEYSLHLYLRRAKAYEALFRLGDEEKEKICSLSQQL